MRCQRMRASSAAAVRCVAEVKLAGDVGRRHDDDKGLLALF